MFGGAVVFPPSPHYDRGPEMPLSPRFGNFTASGKGSDASVDSQRPEQPPYPSSSLCRRLSFCEVL